MDSASPPDSETVTKLLQEAHEGKADAIDRLFPLVYNELRRMAAAKMAGRHSWTLQPTALVHEAYLKLVDQRQANWQNRAHFMAIAATVMQRIVLSYARDRKAQKRGGGAQRTSLEERHAISENRLDEVLAIENARVRLAELDPQQAEIVRLRFFGGMNIEEVAEHLGIGTATVKREWAMARSWLNRELAPRPSS